MKQFVVLLRDGAVVRGADTGVSVRGDALPVAASAGDDVLEAVKKSNHRYEVIHSTVRRAINGTGRLLAEVMAPSGGLPLLVLRLDQEAAAIVRNHPAVLAMDIDAVIGVLLPMLSEDSSVTASQAATSASLDRIDQRSLPLDGEFNQKGDGLGVDAYILDSGVYLGHSEFAGRIGEGANFADDRDVGDGVGNAGDCSGHGTHVASLLGGASHGAAKRVTIHPVRIMKCSNEGALSTALLGFDFVLRNVGASPGRHFVVNLSWGGDKNFVLDAAITRLIEAGGVVVSAAGNEALDACSVAPASSPGVISVGSSTIDDKYSAFTNHGPCVTLMAPGERVAGAAISGPYDTEMMSGTSMASPLVAGACKARRPVPLSPRA
jgi:hypothetical protein